MNRQDSLNRISMSPLEVKAFTSRVEIEHACREITQDLGVIEAIMQKARVPYTKDLVQIEESLKSSLEAYKNYVCSHMKDYENK